MNYILEIQYDDGLINYEPIKTKNHANEVIRDEAAKHAHIQWNLYQTTALEGGTAIRISKEEQLKLAL